MELLQNDDGFVLLGESTNRCLIASKINGLVASSTTESDEIIVKSSCLGKIFGLIGRISLKLTTNDQQTENFLLVITKWTPVTDHPYYRSPIYKILQVAALPLQVSSLSNEVQLQQDFDPCPKHSISNQNNSKPISAIGGMSRKMVKSTKDSLKLLKNSTLSSQKTKNEENPEPVAKLLDEVLRLFNESPSFFTMPENCDLTCRLQKLQSKTTFCDFDDRFFWNRFLLQDLLLQNVGKVDSDFWIRPIVQGFVQSCPVWKDDFIQLEKDDDSPNCNVCLISRRSKFRAGTRYLKRGIDDNGHCANFVETEQILAFADHLLSFVQIRGSIPLFWRQAGFKYRPPIELFNSKTANMLSFKTHLENLTEVYNDITDNNNPANIILVNLIDQMGREKVLGDAYLEYVLDYDSDRVTYAAFDFHDHCRAGMRYESIDLLCDALIGDLRMHKYCWLDQRRESVCRQAAVVRVNCIDCLDRTNVAQSALARRVLEHQLRRTGVLAPDEELSNACKQTLQRIWADNGDAISRQYAGTVALKGDLTRTGQRQLTGLVKDGYNSASRYYMSHMRDRMRQMAIDALLGLMTSQNLAAADIQKPNTEELDETSNERLRVLVIEGAKSMISPAEILLAAWALVKAQPDLESLYNDDMDTVVALTKTCFYVAHYDDERDEFTTCCKVGLNRVVKLEMGHVAIGGVSKMFRGPKMSPMPYIGVTFKDKQSGKRYGHLWKSAGTRLFNNLALPLKSKEDCEEYTMAIFEQIHNALELSGHLINVVVNRNINLELKHFQSSPMYSFIQNNVNQINVIHNDCNKKQSSVIFHCEVGLLFTFTECKVENLIELKHRVRSHSLRQVVKYGKSITGLDMNLASLQRPASLHSSKSDNLLKPQTLQQHQIKMSPSASQFLTKLSSGGSRMLKTLLDNKPNFNVKWKSSTTPIDSTTKSLQSKRDAVFKKYNSRISDSKTKFILL